nr:adenosylmethionine decarboxylase [Beggiatoa alba]
MMEDKIALHGFNNLTKSLSFNIYDICYTQRATEREEFLAYTNEMCSAQKLETILSDVCDIIGAHVLSVSTQDYEPMGASATFLIAEEPVSQPVTLKRPEQTKPKSNNPFLVAHLDKSHLAAHTYPEGSSKTGISTFRVDIDIATCGHISPLKALNYLLRAFDSDVVSVDYRVRGFTRDVRGRKHFIDHKIYSIQEYIASEILQRYQTVDINVYQENLFHTKMLLKDVKLTDYLFGMKDENWSEAERQRVTTLLHQEMTEIFYGKNIFHA